MTTRRKEKSNDATQNVELKEIKYQEYLILAYFKANYKKYDLGELAKIMGMTISSMRKSITRLLEMQYLTVVDDYIIISKEGEKLLEYKGLSTFFLNKPASDTRNEQLSIDTTYVPINFTL